MDIQEIKELLISHEEKRSKPYDDKTGKTLKTGDIIQGKITIGVGRNIQDLGLSEDEIDYLLTNDINRVIKRLTKLFPQFDTFPKEVKLVLIDMMFNLGATRFRQFKNMIKAVKNKDWTKMRYEIENSRWCRQLPYRCQDNLKIIDKFLTSQI